MGSSGERRADHPPEQLSDVGAILRGAERYEHLRPWTGLLTGYIRMGQEAGSVREDLDPEAWTLQMITAAIGAVAAIEFDRGVGIQSGSFQDLC